MILFSSISQITSRHTGLSAAVLMGRTDDDVRATLAGERDAWQLGDDGGAGGGGHKDRRETVTKTERGSG